MKKKGITQKVLMKDFKKFTKFMESGLDFGFKKYGTDGFLADNNFRMLVEEIRDMACYSYLLYRKVKMLQEGILKKEDIKELTRGKSKNESTY